MAQLKTLQDLYIEQLKDLYSAESQITKALPKMIKATTNEQLRAAFQQHLTETEQQVQRLTQVLEPHGEKGTGKPCKGMQGILEEGAELLEKQDKADPYVLDAALLAAAQHVEHYEIAGYGTVVTYAELLGDTNGAQLLKQTLAEEERTDQSLTQLAESSINNTALRSAQAEQQQAERNGKGSKRNN